MFKQKRILVILLALSLVFIAACGGGTSEGTNDDEGPEGDKAQEENGELSGEITFWTLQLSPTFDDYINGVIEDFESEHPDVTVIWEDLPYDQAEQKTLTAASAGNLADVMNLNTDYLKKLASLGALVNMDEAASDVKDEYFEGIWSAGELEGTVYALPWYVTTSGVLYNPDILEEAGFDQPPSTFGEAYEMSKKIKEKTDAFGYAQSGFNFEKYGISLVSDDLTKAAFNTPEAVKLLEEYKGYYDAGLLPDELLLGQAKAEQMYAEEKIAMWETGPQLFRLVEDLSPDVYNKSEAAPAFVTDEDVLSAAIMNVAVANTSEHKDAAVEFAKFITNAENQLAFSKIVAVLPSIEEATEDEFFTQGEDSEDPSEQGKYYAAQQLDKAVNLFPPVEEITAINDVIKEEFHRVLLEDKDPQKALDDMEAQVNELLQ